jgi:hypothetical protein
MRVCKHCGASIEHRGPLALFCSRKCIRAHASTDAKILEGLMLPCKFCRELFTPKNIRQELCTVRCGNRHFDANNRERVKERGRELSEKYRRQRGQKSRKELAEAKATKEAAKRAVCKACEYLTPERYCGHPLNPIFNVNATALRMMNLCKKKI